MSEPVLATATVVYVVLLKGELSRIGRLFLLSFLLSDQEIVLWPFFSIALTMCLIPAGAGAGEEEWWEDDVGHGGQSL